MSTRTNIVVKGNDSVIYKHNDGYPENIHPILVPFLKVFNANRGNDPHYCLASILREFTRQDIIHSDDWFKIVDKGSEPPRDFCMSYGIQTYLSEDIDYLYVVDLEHIGYLDTYEVLSNGKLLHVSGKRLDWWGNDNYRDIGPYNELTSVDQRFHHRRLIPSLDKVQLHLDC